jgi:hypothetical protein
LSPRHDALRIITQETTTMKRTTTVRRQSSITAARIQRAVNGIQIPMTLVVRVYAHAERLIASGADDEQLIAGIRQFLDAPAFA